MTKEQATEVLEIGKAVLTGTDIDVGAERLHKVSGLAVTRCRELLEEFITLAMKAKLKS